MREVGINTLIYSGLNGEVLKQRFRDYIPKTYTHGRSFILNGFKHVKRDPGFTRTVIRDDDTLSTQSSSSSSSSSSLCSSLSDTQSTSSPRSTSTSSTSTVSSSKMRKRRKFDNYIRRMSKRY
tara:strand:+ start:9483 stop:9851 length:369 start_codon:yes stop_codon:yes gene_type:complete